MCRIKNECTIYGTISLVSFTYQKHERFTYVNTRKVVLMPYMKYKNWYIPNCEIAFPTEEEAWEYLEEM